MTRPLLLMLLLALLCACSTAKKEFQATPQSRVVVAFGSCADDRVFPSMPIFDAIAAEKPAALFLIGDTPYIDSTALEVQRKRHAEFRAMPQLAALARTTPIHATWDDHDFGRNDTNGTLEGKENSRLAFMEANKLSHAGNGREGIYSEVRVGPVHVFLLDCRWWAGTEPSFADPDKPTLLGREQWEWLKARLQASDAPFKVLASGMIWNDAVRANKPDYWGAYRHERDALMQFLGEANISGVLLMGGDIHRSRALIHPASDFRAPYAMLELIASPLANNVHLNSKVPHPALIAEGEETQMAMILTIDAGQTPARLLARCITYDGRELFRVERTLDQMTP
ncbi:MAG: alkaline phosphatase family protein [Phycisphaerales bacterium]|nr:alkaline phosphatase family protein [Phycisphaerales bacterium]